jgi:hypothetical protein
MNTGPGARDRIPVRNVALQRERSITPQQERIYERDGTARAASEGAGRISETGA